MEGNPREHPFWKDNLIYCDICGGSLSYCCRCPGGPRGPEFHTRLDVEPHGNDFKSDGDDKFDGL